jgi:hypothetical protein
MRIKTGDFEEQVVSPVASETLVEFPLDGLLQITDYISA